MIYKTFQHRVYANTQGYADLDRVLGLCAELYNAGLEEWRDAYSLRGVSRSLYDQYKEFVFVRKDLPEWGCLSQQIGRGVLKRLDRARQSFFRRVKSGDTPGYPRFKSAHRWHTIELGESTSAMIKERKSGFIVKIKGLPQLRLKKGIELPNVSQLKALSITKRGRRVYANMTYEVEQEVLPQSNTSVGIDMGVTDRLALSNGERITKRRKPNDKLKKAQQRLSRCKKRSLEWKKRKRILANAHSREKVCNRNACHEITTDLIKRFGTIAIEDLKINNMTTKGHRGLTREILEQTWGVLRSQLTYKAAWAGRNLIEVDPRYTSQQCFDCKQINKASRIGKQYVCAFCGYSEDADVNAAKNILARALAGGTFPAAVLEAA